MCLRCITYHVSFVFIHKKVMYTLYMNLYICLCIFIVSFIWILMHMSCKLKFLAYTYYWFTNRCKCYYNFISNLVSFFKNIDFFKIKLRNLIQINYCELNKIRFNTLHKFKSEIKIVLLCSEIFYKNHCL